MAHQTAVLTEDLLGCLLDGSATAKALNYSVNAWAAFTQNLLDGGVPVDNKQCEDLIRLWAMGRKAWLLCGSELAGKRAAAVMSLVRSAKLSGHDPRAYRKDVLTRLPTHLNSRIDELLAHRWSPLEPGRMAAHEEHRSAHC